MTNPGLITRLFLGCLPPLLLGAAPGLRAQPAPPAAGRPAALSGTVAGCADNEMVRAVRPVAGGYLNYFYTTDAPQAAVQGGQFRLTFAPAAAGELVSIQAKCLPPTYAFIEPGATVTLRQPAASAASTEPEKPVFEGANAAGNNLLITGQLFNRPRGVDQNRVLAIMAAGATPEAVLSQLHQALRRCTAKLDSVRGRQLISAACYTTLRAETEQQLLFWSGNLLSAYFASADNRAKMGIRLGDAGMRRLAAALYAEFDPFQPRYQGLGVSQSTAFMKCVMLEKGRLPTSQRPPVPRHWNQYAADFQEINSAFGAYDFAPPAVRARLLGGELLTALVFRPMSNERYAAVFQDYVQQFPGSPYVAVLTQALLREQPAAGATASSAAPAATNPNQDLGRYEEGASALTFAPVAGLDTVTNLAALVRRQFPGRAVFVDFWASWCGPCIAEFRHEPELHAFLTQNGIEPLYVALNNVNYRPKWRDFVVQNQLRGSHYLASAAVQAALGKQFSGIPRYMLFNAQGQLVDDNLPTPGSGAALRERLADKLRLK